MEKVVLLENVRSIFNVGSIFRSADATGMDKIILVGYTATPIDKFGRKNERLNKTALGAEESMKWEHYKTINEVIEKYKDYDIVAVEITNKSIDYKEHKQTKSTIYIFGNEVDGVEEETLKLANTHIHLPMKGKKNSLNVANTASVVMYNIT